MFACYDMPHQISDFSKITLLLQLATSINSHNGLRTTFADESYPNILPELEALVAILLQKYEVIAACYSSVDNSVVVIESTSKTVPGVGLKVPEDELEPNDQRAFTLNPSCSDYTFVPQSLNVDKQHRLTVVPEGCSYWGDVRRYEWCCALMYVYFFYGLYMVHLSPCKQGSYSFVKPRVNFGRLSESLWKPDRCQRTSRVLL